jgi:hypothetical protein
MRFKMHLSRVGGSRQFLTTLKTFSSGSKSGCSVNLSRFVLLYLPYYDSLDYCKSCRI